MRVHIKALLLILHKTKGLVGEDKASLLDVGHIQHAVDERNQMVGDNSGLAPVFFEAVDIILMLPVNFQNADNAVQGPSHIVGHSCREAGFFRIGAFCVIKRLLQLLLLPDLCRSDIFHVQEAHLEAVNYRLIRPVRNSVTTLETVSR